MAEVKGGYQPNTCQPASRRADFDLLRRIARLEILGGPDAGGTNEVTIGGLAPTDSSELWVSSANILYAKVDDEWVAVSGGGGAGGDEVWVGPTAPSGGAYELWFDTDAPTTPLPSEVFVGPADPITANPETELWFDSDAAPSGILRARVGAAWVDVSSPPPVIPNEVVIATADPIATVPEAELWFDSDAAPSGILRARVGAAWVDVTSPTSTAPNEVFVGPDDPIATYPEAELWVDSDAIATLTDDTRWHTAWGIVAMGTVPYGFPLSAPASVVTQATGNLAVTLVSGRRYRVMFRARAQRSLTTAREIPLMLRNGSTALGGSQLTYAPAPGAYGIVSGEWILTGDNAAKSLNVVVNNPGVAVELYVDSDSWFYVEDLGPTVPAGPMPLPTVGLESAKPASPASPMRYFATDTKRDWLYDGTGWIIMSEPIMTYTPATTNINGGTGATNYGSYQRGDGWCDFAIELTLGSGGTLTGQPTLGLPNAAAVAQRYQFAAMYTMAGVNNFRGFTEGVAAGSTTITPYATGGNPATGQEYAMNVTATYPFTWASGCKINLSGRYRMSSKYS